MFRQEERRPVGLKEIPSLTATRQDMAFQMLPPSMEVDSFFVDCQAALPVVGKVLARFIAKSHCSFLRACRLGSSFSAANGINGNVGRK
jgi:hypothetical protein